MIAVATASRQATRDPERRLLQPTAPAVREVPPRTSQKSTATRYIPNLHYHATGDSGIQWQRRLPPGAMSYTEVDQVTRGFRERGILLDVQA
ncbi:hypothetical protein KDL45_16425 [bacterium]|nr:hypothetical protein [bacterium]